jgi:hypothetical protein
MIPVFTQLKNNKLNSLIQLTGNKHESLTAHH